MTKPNARVLAVLNLKGGVGKTHTSWLLSAVCQERQHRFLAIDLDTQGNLSGSFLTQEQMRPGVEMLFDPGAETDPKTLIRHTEFSHIDIIPASVALAPFDESDQRKWERTDLHLALIEAVSQLRGQYDYIVFDCPPRLSLVSFAALCASDALIIPMEAADWGAQGIVQVTAAMEYVQQRFNKNLHLLGYLVSRFKRSRLYQQTYQQRLHAHFGEDAMDTYLPDLAAFEKSVTDRIPITLHAPRSNAAGIARNSFDEVERRLAKLQPSGQQGRRSDVRRQGVAAVSK